MPSGLVERTYVWVLLLISADDASGVMNHLPDYWNKPSLYTIPDIQDGPACVPRWKVYIRRARCMQMIIRRPVAE